MAAVRIRCPQLVLTVIVAMAVLAAGCDSASATGGGTGCDHWCGTGSATVTMRGTTTTVSGGGCYDGGSAGVDVRFGDWRNSEGLSSYVMLVAYRTGGASAAPTPTPAPSDHLAPTAIGSVNGNPFTLGSDTVVTLDANGTGSFSGTDVNGYGLVKGTFTCG